MTNGTKLTNDPWASLLASLNKFSDDYMSERDQPIQQERIFADPYTKK